MTCVLSSEHELRAIFKKRIFSKLLCLVMPSAIFEGTERLERVIWSLKPKSLQDLNAR